MKRIALVGAECEENLAIRYIRGALEQAGHTVIQVDFNRREDLDHAARAVVESGASIAGLSMMFLRRSREFAALARRIRELGFSGHIIAGGHFAAFNAEALLRDEPSFDSVAIGEGENIMLDLAARHDHPGEVRGLVWRNSEGTIVRNLRAEKPPDLDTLPPPSRKWPPDTYLGMPAANMVASRGCTHACSFCSVSAWHRLCGGPKLRLRSPASVAAEISDLYGRGYRVFKFSDDNFIPRDRREAIERISALRRELSARGVGRIAFAVKCRPDSADRELFSMMKEMGLFRVFVGIEAGTAESLAKLGRRQTVGQNEAALEVLNSLDLHVCFNLILFNPDSTAGDFIANVAFLRRHPVNPMNFCRAEIYPGTMLERSLGRAGRLEGTYWGHDYKIADPRAEEAFRLMDGCFSSRHHGQSSPHVLSLKLDFERRLFAHFHSCSRSMSARAGEFIRRLNLDTCAYLEEIGMRAAQGFSSEADRRGYVGALLRRVERDNAMFIREAELLIEELHHETGQASRVPQGAWTRAAAVFGVAASLSLAGTATGQANAEPRARGEAAAGGPEPARNADAAGVEAVIRETVRGDILPVIGRELSAAEPVTVIVGIGEDGAVTNCHYTVASGARTNSLREATVALLGVSIPQADPGLYKVRFSCDELIPHMKPVLGEKEGDPIVVQKGFEAAALPFLAARVKPYQDFRIELWVGACGKVEQAWIFVAKAPRAEPATPPAGAGETVAELVRRMGVGGPAERAAATAKLAAMGPAIMGLLKNQLEAATDPEIAERCYRLVRDLGGGLPLESDSDAIVFLRSLQFGREETFGKRFVVPITKWQLERAASIYDRQEDTHEMAPAPAR